MNRTLLFLRRNFLLSLLVLFCFSLSTYAQETNSEATFDYVAELNRSVPIPNSPEAEAFTQYGNTPVNMYSGSPEIGIPIYTHQGRELNLPINLTYDASGIKVEQLATASGLGWNLAVGGRISRITNGNPDDYIQSLPTPHKSFWDNEVQEKMLKYYDERTSFGDRDSVVEYFDFMNKISINEVDTQPDYYSFNALGVNDYIAFDVETRQAYALNDPNIDVSFSRTSQTGDMRSITSWVITGSDGTRYFFEQAEVTDYDGNDLNQQFAEFKIYNSSWVLTKVISANSRDIYEFDYLDLGFWSQNFSVSGYSSYTYTIDENTPEVVGSPAYVTSSVPQIRINQFALERITHNGKEIVSIDYTARYDLGASQAIDAITIKNGTTQEYKTYDFLTSYFGISSGQNPASEIPSHIRLKLDGIDIRSNSDDLYQKYRFEYFSPDGVPPVVSKGQDYMGYYNGQNANGVLFPEVTVGQHTFGGANRSIDFNDAIKGTLSRIHYPTGGYTDFEFESHTSPVTSAETNQNTEDVTYASVPLLGSFADDVSCNEPVAFCDCSGGNNINWCADLYGPTGKPNFVNHAFNIEQAGTYTLTYREHMVQTGNVPTGFKILANLFKISDNANCGPQSTLDVKDVINLADGDLLIDDNDLIFNNDFHEHQLDATGQKQVYLTPGCYQILLVNPNDNINLHMRVSRVETTTETTEESTNVARAGIRIKTIKDYTSEGELATEKQYLYKTSRFSNVSSGNIVFNPQFYTINNGLTTLGPDDNCQIADATSIFVTGNSSGGSQPHVAYSRVYEIFKKGTTEQDNGGYIQHDFFIDQRVGLYSDGVPPNVSSYRPTLAVGQEINIKTFDNSNKTLQEVSTELATTNNAYHHFSSFGLYVINKPERVFDFLVTRPYLSGYTFDFQQKQYGLYSTGEGDASTACAYVYPDQPPGYIRHIRDYVPSVDMRVSSVSGAVGGMIRQVSTSFYGNTSEDKQLQTTQEYEYDNSIGHLVSKKTTILEDDEQIEENYTYSSELTDAVYLQMQTDNQLTVPVIVETKADNAITIRKTNYSQVNNGFYPTSIEITNDLIYPITGTTSNNPNEDRIYFEYYTDGNIKTSYQVDTSSGSGTPTSTQKINKTSYIWGYDNRYPIAKIVNASHSEIASYVSSLESLAQSDNDRTFGYSGNEGALRQALDTMRNDATLSHTQITTYTYDPLIGITSMTDPRGYTMYYEYDPLYRLKYVKDSQGNILSENEYNYRINN